MLPMAIVKRQRQVAVGDGSAKRRFPRCAHHIDMNPLVVAGRFGELVDAILTDFEPVADSKFLAHPAAEIIKAGKF